MVEIDEALTTVLLERLLADGSARQLREAAGLRLSDVARVVGVAPSTAGRWEERRTLRPRAKSAARYAELLGRLADMTGHELPELP